MDPDSTLRSAAETPRRLPPWRTHRYWPHIRPASTWRGGLVSELSLALPPTLTVLVVIVLIQGLSHQKLLFASLASSAFLIYYDPIHRMNTVRVMASAQLLGCTIGIVLTLVLGAGYIAGALAMALTILLCVVFDIVHPPAISTALAFAFVPVQGSTIELFLLALALVAALVMLQRISLWLVHRIERQTKDPT